MKCECCDPKCPVHPSVSHCDAASSQVLYRIDMTDETGEAFCEACASDAWDTGLYTDSEDSEDSETFSDSYKGRCALDRWAVRLYDSP